MFLRINKSLLCEDLNFQTDVWLLTAYGKVSPNINYVWMDNKVWDDSKIWTENIIQYG